MIYDSEQQRAFILEAVKKYPTSYENALQLANAFGQSIQDGKVVSLNEQNKAFPPATAGSMPTEAKLAAPAPVANRRARRASRKKDTPPKAEVN